MPRRACTVDPTTSLELQLDAWEAIETIPVRPVPRRWPLVDAPMEPAVDPDVWLLHVRWYRRREAPLRSALVEEYEAPTRHLARRYYRHREPLDDLVQVAMEALLQALDRFDPRRRVPFLGFASPTITGALKRHYRDTGWGIRIPRQAQELAAFVAGAREVLEHDLGRPATVGELADFAAVGEDDIEAAMRAVDARNADSVEATMLLDGTSRVLAVEDRDLRRAEDHVALTQALELLDDDERDVLHRYFELSMSQADIAAELGVSQMHVSRVVRRAVGVLRSHMPA